MNRRAVLVGVVVGVLATAGLGFAQFRGGGRGGPGGPGPGGRGPGAGAGPGQAWVQLKDLLQADEEQWTVLAPRLSKVMTLAREADAGGLQFRGGRGRGGPGPGGPRDGAVPRGMPGGGRAPRGMTEEGAAPRGMLGGGRAPRAMTEEGAAPRGMLGGGRAPRAMTEEGAAPRGEGPERPLSAVAAAEGELQKALDSEASATEVAAKLKALRAARAKAQQELKAARAAVREGVNPRQEAQLVLLGVLD